MTPQEQEDASLDNKARDRFRRWDLNHNGRLDKDEIQAALSDAKVPVTNDQIEALYQLMANKDSEQVELEDFMKFVRHRRKALKTAFESICAEGDTTTGKAHPRKTTSNGEAYFTAGQLRRAASRANIPLSDQNVGEIMSQIDRNHDGSVTFDEFVNCLNLVPHINPHVFFDRWFVDAFDDYTIGFRFPREIRLREGEEFVDMAIRKIACGGVAGVVSRTLTAPVDRVRLLMMTSGTLLGIGAAYHRAVSHPTGYRALWIGNGVNCVKIAPEMALKLYAFDAFKTAIARDPDNVSMMERFVAGGCAGALAEFTVYPMDVLRTRMATGLYRDVPSCARAVWSDGGARAYFAGLTPSIIGIIPYAAIDLSMYSVLRDLAVAHLTAKGTEVSVPLLLSCGMLSSAMAATLTFPIMVVRTKAQATNMSIKAVVLKLWGEGIRGFYRGLAPSLMTVMPATSISYASYEWLNSRWTSYLS